MDLWWLEEGRESPFGLLGEAFLRGQPISHSAGILRTVAYFILVVVLFRTQKSFSLARLSGWVKE